MKSSAVTSRRAEMLQVLFIAMEISWLGAILVFFDIVIETPKGASLAWTASVYAPAYVVGRITRIWRISNKSLLLINIVTAAAFLVPIVKALLLPDLSWCDFERMVLGFYGLFGPDRGWRALAVILVGGLYIWVRGWYLSRKQAEATAFFTGFQVGFIVILTIVLLISLADVPFYQMPGLITAFFISGLTGLYLARLTAMDSGRKTAGPNPWLVIMPVAIGSILAAGLAVMVYLDRDLVLVLLRPLEWLWEQLVRLIEYLAGLIDPEPPRLPMDPMGGGPGLDMESAIPRWDFAWLKTIGHIFFIVGSTGLILAALFRFLQDLLRWLRRKLDDQGIVVESLDTGFWEDLTAFLRVILRRTRQLVRWLSAIFKKICKIGEPPRISETEAVRNTYRRMLKWGASKGFPKSRDQTPHEYLETLKPILGDKADAFRAATQTYVKARYGPVPPDRAQVFQIKKHWQKIKARPFRKRKSKRTVVSGPSPSFSGGLRKEEV